jgi:hypothetical protein
MRERGYPQPLQRQIGTYYARYLNDFADIETGRRILAELPPPLRTEIMLALNQHIIEKVRSPSPPSPNPHPHPSPKPGPYPITHNNS